ncbi:MAG: prephenate dehydratase [Leptospirales bacterium]|nr:prephenate dehydratase [Leptospirales bacterium]
MPSEDEELRQWREGIDHADQEIIRAIMRRTDLVRKIGEVKRRVGAAVYRPDREKEVYDNLRRLVESEFGAAPPMPLAILRHIYREIMSGSIAVEGGPVVSYLGPPASFSHEATLFRFGSAVRALAVDTIPDVFRAVEALSSANFGVVPVDNTTEGAVGVTLEMFLRSELKVYAEHYIRVTLNLLHHEEMDLSAVRRIYTLRIAREQCREWLQQNLNLSQIELVETSSTAAAARLAAERKDGAAIASQLAAETYGLKVLRAGIQEKSYNITRFFVVGAEQCPPTGDDKTSMVCSVRDKPGSLYRMLTPFERSGINLTRIESRASRRAFGDYNFFIDFEGHQQSEAVRAVLAEVEEHTSFLKILGSYPRMDLP